MYNLIKIKVVLIEQEYTSPTFHLDVNTGHGLSWRQNKFVGFSTTYTIGFRLPDGQTSG